MYTSGTWTAIFRALRKRERMRKPATGLHTDTNAILAGLLLLFAALWLGAYMTGKLDTMQETLRPHLPSWFALANLLILPITCALAGSHSLSFRTGLIFVLIFVAQLSVLGLSAEKYRVAKGLVTVFLYYETFSFSSRNGTVES